MIALLPLDSSGIRSTCNILLIMTYHHNLAVRVQYSFVFLCDLLLIFYEFNAFVWSVDIERVLLNVKAVGSFSQKFFLYLLTTNLGMSIDMRFPIHF